jgi:hypothetical protein
MVSRYRQMVAELRRTHGMEVPSNAGQQQSGSASSLIELAGEFAEWQRRPVSHPNSERPCAWVTSQTSLLKQGERQCDSHVGVAIRLYICGGLNCTA